MTLIERKSRVPQLQGVQGRSCSRLPRALGNAEDGVASAFPQGKQNEINLHLNLTYRAVIKMMLFDDYQILNQIDIKPFHFVYDQLGYDKVELA